MKRAICQLTSHTHNRRSPHTINVAVANSQFWNGRQKKKFLLTGFSQSQVPFSTAVDNRVVKFEVESPGAIDLEANTQCEEGRLKEALPILPWIQLGIETCVRLLQECANAGTLAEGKLVHTHMIKVGFRPDISLGNHLANMYAKCRCLEDARQIFEQMPMRNVVSWNMMISRYAKCGSAGWAGGLFEKFTEGEGDSCNSQVESLKLFGRMQRDGRKPDRITYASVLGACTVLKDIEQGAQMHCLIIKSGFESNVFVGSALVDMYAKCWSLEDSRQVFDKMSNRDVVLWNVIIAGYAQNGYVEEALRLFSQMEWAGTMPDEFTLGSLLSGCGSLSALDQGKQVHVHVIRNGFEFSVFVGSALVDMYAKCGNIGDARNVFDKIVALNIVSWNSMIAGYAQHGHSKEALALCEQMQEKGIKPNGITFIAVLSACSHVGKLDEGLRNFDFMSECGIPQKMEHYACMVDLLGRAGKLDEAEKLINAMASMPSSVVWQSLLGCCRIHNHTELGIWAANSLIDLEPHNSATYVSLSNIYAAAGMWEEVEKVRRLMKDRGLKKEPGHSWIEIKNKVHLFVASDRS